MGIFLNENAMNSCFWVPIMRDNALDPHAKRTGFSLPSKHPELYLPQGSETR
jgi:hypothetical protein